jgi:hypothetical protein
MSFDPTGDGKPAKSTAPTSVSRSSDKLKESSLSKEARELLARLSECVPLDEVARQFPHIVNKLAQVWSKPTAVHKFLDSLLFDGRAGRQGFPLDVFTQLARLRSYCAKVYPKKTDAWDQNLLR